MDSLAWIHTSGPESFRGRACTAVMESAGLERAGALLYQTEESRLPAERGRHAPGSRDCIDCVPLSSSAICRMTPRRSGAHGCGLDMPSVATKQQSRDPCRGHERNDDRRRRNSNGGRIPLTKVASTPLPLKLRGIGRFMYLLGRDLSFRPAPRNGVFHLLLLASGKSSAFAITAGGTRNLIRLTSRLHDTPRRHSHRRPLVA